MISEKEISQSARFFTVVHASTEKSLNEAHKIFQPFKLHLHACKLVIFIDMSMYILTETGRRFKIFLKENDAIALDSCYLFTKKC